jgi:acetolactate decarboxylase
MKRLGFLVIGLFLLLSGCVNPQTDTVFQTSTIDALLAGVYDGDMTCRSLLKQGDLGIGTFNDLDGEMVVLDGKLHQVKADGKVYEPELSVRTPFAAVCCFKSDIEFSIETGSDFAKVEELISDHASNQNLIYAIKITGQFRSMRTRSVPRQNKPYPPLSEVTAHQPEFAMENITGTIVGFRFPAYVKGINMPGYHMHFISSDHTRGGHILSFELVSGKCEIDVLHQYVLRLPEGNAAFGETDLTKDRSLELKKVEGGK